MEQLLPIPLALATDCAELTANTTMGILSSQGAPSADRGRAAPLFARSAAGDKGLIGPSTYLSPYQVLLLGQGDTLDLLEHEMREYLPDRGYLAAQAEPLATLAYAAGVGA